MSRFVVFDVETPNRYNNRMSAIGIDVIEDGVIVDEYYSLVNPEQPFDYFNTRLTGISAETVAGAPTFPELWGEIEPLMSSGLLVAHNAIFDMNVLKKSLYLHRAAGQTAAARCEPQAQRCMRPLRNLPESPSGKQRQPRLRRDTFALSPIRRRRQAVHKNLFTE